MATTTSGINKVGNNFYNTSVTTNADGSLKATTFRTDSQGNNGVPVSTVNTTSAGVSTRTPEPGATAAETAAFNNPNSPERQAYTQQVQSQNPYGANPTAEQQKAINTAAGTPNKATNSPNPPSQAAAPPTPEQSAAAAAAAAEADSFKAGTRKKYENLRYPENLSLETQDVIKFTILQYKPSLAGKNATQTGRIVDLNGIVAGTTVLGSITLPIPAGISDGNTVGWAMDDSLNDLQEAAAQGANIFLSGGSAEEASQPAMDKLKGPELKDTVRGIITGMAAQNQNVAKRTLGATPNNNQELLFGSAGLRNFTFGFSFYPRSEPEAIIVRKIIRTFKQSMSVKRSETSLLLKSPHTFAIQYMTTGKKQHPYLNRFKECALTSCSVDYTPDGTYMTYGGSEKSMTAYKMTLQFGELEPLFDDEYGESDYNNVGF